MQSPKLVLDYFRLEISFNIHNIYCQSNYYFLSRQNADEISLQNCSIKELYKKVGVSFGDLDES